MSLIELEHVSKSYGRGPGRRIGVDDASLAFDAGELVAVWGRRRSGRTTLLRVVAGLELPDSGIVRFAGCDLRRLGSEVRGGGIGYCRTSFCPAEGRTALDQLMVSQLARGVSLARARSNAREALERVAVGRYASLRTDELDGAQTTRVAIARALCFHPQLLVADEPSLGVDLLARDGIWRLLRSLADEGIAVLASAAEADGLMGADRSVWLDEGALTLGPVSEPATVIPLRRVGGASADA